MRAQLSEIEVGAGAVADVHGFAEALLAVVAVEDNAVEDDGYGFEDNLDDAADEGPILFIFVSKGWDERGKGDLPAFCKPVHNRHLQRIVLAVYCQRMTSPKYPYSHHCSLLPVGYPLIHPTSQH